MSLHPGVKSLAAVSPEQRTELNKKTARLMERLVTDTCLAQTREAVKYEGESTFQTSFGILGQAAVQELFTNPTVAEGLAAFAKEFDEKKLREALKPDQKN